MPTSKSNSGVAPSVQPKKGMFINVGVTESTRDGLAELKNLMDARSQSEVIARLVLLGLSSYDAIHRPMATLVRTYEGLVEHPSRRT